MSVTSRDTTTPPGTVLLSERSDEGVNLFPTPTTDPNDPLNWSKLRKSVNFGLALIYVLFTFVSMNIGIPAYPYYVADLGLDFTSYTAGSAVIYATLGVGCFLFMPLVYKYGRRPIYIVSLLVQLGSVIWGARIQTSGEYIALNAVLGFGGAISETLVQITIADLFFVHRYATMNGLYLFMQATGSFLGPVAGGYIIEGQGWRWIWWWCTIFIGVSLVLVIFLFEDTGYIPVVAGDQAAPIQVQDRRLSSKEEKIDNQEDDGFNRRPGTGSVVLDNTPRRSLRQRLALYTPTNMPVRHHFYQPLIILVEVPAVFYAGITFGSCLAWYSVLLTVAATKLIEPPYSFTSTGVGLFYFAPFVGNLLATPTLGPLSDWMIVRLARRNNGIYEPEMRLYPGIPCAIIAVTGILVFGIGFSHELPWITLAAGIAIYTAGFIGCTDTAMSYLTDSYSDIIGDAMVGVVFLRNACSVVVLFSLSHWLKNMGIQNTFILLATIAFTILMLPIPLLIWGKKLRIRSAGLYDFYASRQPARRTE